LLEYKIAVTQLPFVGDANGKKLIAYCGGVEAVFRESKKNLLKIPGLPHKVIDSIRNSKAVFERVEKEIRFIEDNGIRPLFFLDDDYPQRLKNCADGPMMLYYKGTAGLNAARVVSVVGTRTPTNYGKAVCEKMIATLKEAGVLVISGLAYGIDICAHRNSLKNGIATVGVLGSGMDKIYPAANKNTAMEMMENGGILTEFLSGTEPERQNFPQRNRIVAGMADVTVVVESGQKGGSMITAGLAFDYNRDVAAFPGRAGDKLSKGCNSLIKRNIASLIESGDDLLKLMNWEKSIEKKNPVQRSFFVEMNETEKVLYNLLKDGKKHNIDMLSIESGLPMSKTSASLLSLEFKGVVQSLPGKSYKLL
jgi:DNA processing protein